MLSPRLELGISRVSGGRINQLSHESAFSFRSLGGAGLPLFIYQIEKISSRLGSKNAAGSLEPAADQAGCRLRMGACGLKMRYRCANLILQFDSNSVMRRYMRHAACVQIQYRIPVRSGRAGFVSRTSRQSDSAKQ